MHPWNEFESRNHAVSMHVGGEGSRWTTVSGNQSDLGDPPAPAPEDAWQRIFVEHTGSPPPIITEDGARARGFSEWTSSC